MDDATLRLCTRRLRTALDLADTGIQLYQAQLQRRFPDASQDKIARMLGAWLLMRRGAEGGDAQGHRVELTRFATIS